MIAIKIREDIFQYLINNGSAVMTFRGGSAENYTINEKNSGIPYREIVITESIDEEKYSANVVLVSNKLTLEDNKALEVMIDDALAWNAIEIRDSQANNLIK